MTGRAALVAASVAAVVACSTSGAAARSALTDPIPSSVGPGVIVFNDDPVGAGYKQLYVERSDGSARRQLVHSSDDDVQPSLSSDGRTIGFIRMREHGNLPDQIFLVGIDRQHLHQLKPGGCPAEARCGDAVEGHAFSPNGNRLVFTRAVFLAGQNAPDHVEL